jgi:hypothetical protein
MGEKRGSGGGGGREEAFPNVRRNQGFPVLPPSTLPPFWPDRICAAGCKLKMPLTDPPQNPATARSFSRLPQGPAFRPRGCGRSPGTARGSPAPRPAAAAAAAEGTSVFLSPPSLLLDLLLLLADSSRRILHVNNIQALFTVAAGRRGTHASTLEEDGGGEKRVRNIYTRPAPPPPQPRE